MYSVTIIIFINQDNQTAFKTSLDSIVSLKDEVKKEIIIVDMVSAINSINQIQKSFAKFDRLLIISCENDESKAFHKALKLVHGDYICTIYSGFILNTKSVITLIQAMKDSEATIALSSITPISQLQSSDKDLSESSYKIIVDPIKSGLKLNFKTNYYLFGGGGLFHKSLINLIAKILKVSFPVIEYNLLFNLAESEIFCAVSNSKTYFNEYTKNENHRYRYYNLLLSIRNFVKGEIHLEDDYKYYILLFLLKNSFTNKNINFKTKFIIIKNLINYKKISNLDILNTLNRIIRI